MVDGPFFRHHLSKMVSLSQKQRLVRSPTKRTTKHVLYKQRIASSGSPVFKAFFDDERGPPERSHQIPCERKATGVANAAILGSVVEMFPASERRPVADSGDRAANQRRSEIDREDGLGKPGRVPCQEGDHVATAAATPAGG